MKNYKMTNFAQVSVVDHLETDDSMTKRTAYIEFQLIEGFKKKLESYLKEENNSFLWETLTQNSQELLIKIANLYRQNEKNPQIIFQLEQILGHSEYLFDSRGDAISLEFQNNLHNIHQLTKYLSGHESPAFRYIGIILTLIGIASLISSAVFISLFSIASGIGLFIGAALIIAGVLSIMGSYQKGLSQTASVLIDSMSQPSETMTYYDSFISPMLTEQDNLHIRPALEEQIQLGFSAKTLKGALVWAKRRHDSMPTLIASEKYDSFFSRIADISYLSRNDDYWLSYVRQPSKISHQPTLQPNDESTKQQSNSNGLFTLWKKSYSSYPVITYFDNIVSPKLKNESDKSTLKSGLERLLKCGFSSEDLTAALQWAVERDNKNEAINPDDQEEYGDSFERIVDICGVVLEPKEITGVQMMYA